MDLEELLREVIDPETNYSILEMGFLKRLEIGEEGVTIVLSPNTFWCPPTILYMILEDLREKLSERGYQARIVIEDHHDAERITNCINKGLGFHECYGSESLGIYYEELRKRLLEKHKRKLGGDREAKVTMLSLDLNGELCRLVGMARRSR